MKVAVSHSSGFHRPLLLFVEPLRPFWKRNTVERTLGWIAQELHLGTKTHVSNAVPRVDGGFTNNSAKPSKPKDKREK
jgi:hypothetical protein